jgi:hypothetical protein
VLIYSTVTRPPLTLLLQFASATETKEEANTLFKANENAAAIAKWAEALAILEPVPTHLASPSTPPNAALCIQSDHLMVVNHASEAEHAPTDGDRPAGEELERLCHRCDRSLATLTPDTLDIAGATDLIVSPSAAVRALRVSMYGNTAAAHNKLENYEATLKAVEQVMTIEAGNVKAMFRRGVAFFGLGMLDEAATPSTTIPPLPLPPLFWRATLYPLSTPDARCVGEGGLHFRGQE